MSNIMINSFKQIIEDKQKDSSHGDFSINEDKKIIKVFKESLKYLAISLHNTYEVENIKIEFCDITNNYNDCIYETENGIFEESLKLQYFVELSQNVKINYIIFCNNTQHLSKLEKNYEGLITTFDIISQTLYNKYLEDCIKELSLKDQITGLYNRKYLETYLDNILALSRRENKKVAFLKIRIDKFKAVIDEFDYKIGDKVLIALAKLLKHTVRSSDIVVRVDGDEFLVVLQNIGNEENAIMIAEKLITLFGEEKVLINENTNQTLMKTICIGISLFPDNAENIDEILRTSDNALYEARNQGRSKYFVFNDTQMHTIDLF